MYPIVYCIHGSPTEEDLAVLAEFTQFLNTIEGFPDIGPTKDSWEANLDIHFCTREEMVCGMDAAACEDMIRQLYTNTP